MYKGRGYKIASRGFFRPIKNTPPPPEDIPPTPTSDFELVVVDTTKPCKDCKHYKSSHKSRMYYPSTPPTAPVQQVKVTKCEKGCNCKEYVGVETIKKFSSNGNIKHLSNKISKEGEI